MDIALQSPLENAVAGGKGNYCSGKIRLMNGRLCNCESEHSLQKSVRGLRLSLASKWVDVSMGQTKLRCDSATLPIRDTSALQSLASPGFFACLPTLVSHLASSTMYVPETTQAAASMSPPRPDQSSSPSAAEEAVADAALDHQEERTTGDGDTTSQSTPARASTTTEAATGDKRKRGDDAGEPGDGIKRQMIALPFRGRAAVAPPSYQKQQVLVGSEVQTESQGSITPPSENQHISEMQLDATEGQKFLNALYSAVSIMRMLRQRWDLYEDSRGQYRRRRDVIESFQAGLEELEKKKHRTTVDPKHLDEIAEYRNQLNHFTPGLNVLKEEMSGLLRAYDGLHDDLDSSVEGVLAYDESLKDDEALRFLPATFWKAFKERKEAAIAAAESATTKRKEIEDERAAIRKRMEGRFKQNLIARLTKSGATSATAPMEEDLRRLPVLVLQQKDLQDKEDELVEVLRAQAGKLLKIAEQALVDAELLESDNDT